jgi:hypothetical protein
LERLRTTKLEGAAVLAQLTDLYTSSCYGDVDIPPDVVADLRRETHQIELGG